ncbi:MAG: hypothetical protein BWY88_01196 [Synergistetes bacterium ADurb.Bin520]|nr:MAG: hypothetical protein BWY88_01196 [Synergistetes bacterium ADurb.Bin520]
MAKAKAPFSFSVNTAVWVRNPGPMADVAMRNAAPKRIASVPFRSSAAPREAPAVPFASAMPHTSIQG